MNSSSPGGTVYIVLDHLYMWSLIPSLNHAKDQVHPGKSQAFDELEWQPSTVSGSIVLTVIGNASFGIVGCSKLGSMAVGGLYIPPFHESRM